MVDPLLDEPLEARRGRLRRLRTFGVGYFVGGLALWLVAAAVASAAPGLDRLLVRVFFAWALGVLLLSIVLVRARCPGCGERFFFGPRGGTPFAGACRRCRLPLHGRSPAP